MPRAADGQAAATSLALLDHQRNICDSIAGRVLSYWGGLGHLSDDDQQAAVREHVLEKQLADLAESRTTGDLIENTLRQASQENTSEGAASLSRLASLERELCDLVALPTAPRESFEGQIGDVLDRIEIERGELGRLVVIDEAVVEGALAPFLPHIQRAGIQAQGEYLAYLESIRPKPQGPTMLEVMQQWHRDSYVPGVAAVKQAFGLYLQARKQQNPREIGKTCRALSAKASALLRAEDVLEAPDDRIEPLLRPIYIEMRSLSTDCLAGRSREMQDHLVELQKKLADAAELLSRYGVQP